MNSLNRNKSKITQNDLRRIMSEKKRDLLPQKEKKIDSPYAKYRDDGKLTCTLCNSVHIEKVWKVHVSGRQHQEMIRVQMEMNSKRMAKSATTKRHLPEGDSGPPKKIKGILKNSAKPELPPGFFDSKEEKVSLNNKSITKMEVDTDDSTSDRKSSTANSDSKEEEVDDSEKTEEDLKSTTEIPEGFFDDPKLDAKARNIEYKDPIQEEWDRFQKEIKEENTVSAQIIEYDQEEAIAERQIDEIDEQLRNWSRVLDLEVKKEKIQAEPVTKMEETTERDSSDEEPDFDEFLDWRAKKSFR
ncbi:zinc finger protein 830 [Nilaparvata lugens]|uniref:zinc finger protein 830 n=1 Tax=Nilaparvata lugens TaxID=108931 RepID=UPI00193E4683|nr:zinc finger protein 830 [Nilaparvata lugens]